MNTMLRVKDYLLTAGRTDLAEIVSATSTAHGMQKAELRAEIDKLRAELEAANMSLGLANISYESEHRLRLSCETALEERDAQLMAARAELAELRARAGELERQVRDKHEAATVDEICNAYESGVGHRGRPTASVNPYRQGSDLATAYNIGALGDRESPAAAAVPEDVAKDAEISDSVLLKAYTTETNKVLPHSWRPIYLKYARIGIRAAILAADTEVKK